MEYLITLATLIFCLSCQSKSEVDYDQYIKKCNGNSCCESSIRNAKASESIILEDGKSCPDGYRVEMQKCIGSKRWCVKL
ncbi:hypothetical protein [Halobacteriovorax sp. DA5]|uniref:hypothetical protein n=1 Tax=Halobacteriovorax sp. DA5 TaxID=2067553 RepID=UPI000CD201A7|nr:hypothetical protein [Halobacteriovorax sp. DA5]POB12543.1 hypothetical protein C0Z22_14555 [Halobacteriovorax sp. DA5]